MVPDGPRGPRVLPGGDPVRRGRAARRHPERHELRGGRAASGGLHVRSRGRSADGRRRAPARGRGRRGPPVRRPGHRRRCVRVRRFGVRGRGMVGAALARPRTRRGGEPAGVPGRLGGPRRRVGLGGRPGVPPGAVRVRADSRRGDRGAGGPRLPGGRTRSAPLLPRLRDPHPRGGRLHAHERRHRVRAVRPRAERGPGPRAPGGLARGRGGRGRAPPDRSPPRRGRGGPEPLGRPRRGQALPLPAREVRRRRRRRRPREFRELRRLRLPGSRGIRQPRLVRHRGGPRARPAIVGGLRGGFRPVPRGLRAGDRRARGRPGRPRRGPPVAPRGGLGPAPDAARRRAGQRPHRRRDPRPPGLGPGTDRHRGVLRGRPLGEPPEPPARRRVRRGPPRRLRPDPARRQRMVRGRGGDGERRPRRGPQRASAEGASEPRGPRLPADRARGADPQQGRGGGRPVGARLEHELGAWLRDGEPRDRRPDRGRGGCLAPRGGLRGRLGGPADPARGGRDDHGPRDPPGALRLHRGRVGRVAAENETERQRSKAPAPDGSAWPPPNCSPPPTSRSSGTVP